MFGGAVAVVAGDLEHAWLLKEAVEPTTVTRGTRAPSGARANGSRVLLARPMSCKIDPNLAIPSDVAARAGHRLPDDQP